MNFSNHEYRHRMASYLYMQKQDEETEHTSMLFLLTTFTAQLFKLT